MLRTLRGLVATHCRAAATSSNSAVSPISRSEIDSALFDDVQSRVNQHGRTIEKILVTLVNKDGSKKDYLMNRNVSTPFDCAKHMNMLLAKRAILALTSYSDGNTQLECMNEPFRDKCSLELLDFQNEKYAAELNKAYWRSCSVLLAAILSEGLKDHVSVSALHCEVPKSYFAVDINGLASSLSQSDLRDLSLFARSQFIDNSIPFETVSLPAELATDYGFDSSLRLCRLGTFVTAVDGPVISRSDQVGRFSIVKVNSTSGSDKSSDSGSDMYERLVRPACRRRDACNRQLYFLAVQPVEIGHQRDRYPTTH
ncbi:hypothetical protein Y032_0019g3958 [Ancylostoma ceylanicum]|uniref:TGS domain-containing protein n=1 Tax=Ancylostoma ceylanicum TaxID=53326 RepID=A0A016V4M4_9BILA|nr:hypothetical protein Y032_0019g3958 [Ancylostoma ceylanicum]